MSQAGIINVIENNPDIPINFEASTGSATALFNTIRFIGTGGIVTSATGNTVTIDGSSITASVTLDGNTGSATGSTISIVTANGTPKFAASGSTVTLDFGLNNLNIGSSMSAVTTGGQNTGFGENALASITSGDTNTCIGARAGNGITNSLHCTSVGYNSLSSNCDSDNTAIGYQAMVNAVSGGFNNTSLGSLSLQGMTTGQYNVACGMGALSGLSTGVDNMGLGYYAGFNLTGSDSHNIMIKSPGVSGDNGVMRLGDPSAQSKCYISGINGNTLNPVAGLVSIDPSTGQLGVGPTDANGNTFVGSSNANTSIITNGASQNTGIGVDNLQALTSGAHNLSAGYYNLESCTSGSSNVALGYGIFQQLTTGSYNIGIGQGAGASLKSSASYNVMIGYDAGVNCVDPTSSSNIYISNSGNDLENNTMRLGTTGAGANQVNSTFIAGISGVTVGGTPSMVVINPANDQMGTRPIVAFSAYLSATTSNLTGDASTTTVVFDIATVNLGGGYDPTTGIFIAPVAGTYMFSSNLLFTNITTQTSLICWFYNNFSIQTRFIDLNPASILVGDQTGGSGSYILKMAAGDSVRIQINAGNTTKTVGLIGTQSYTTFGGFLIA